MNIVIQNTLLLNADFGETLEEVMEHLTSLWREGQRGPLMVAVNCKWGKHRSVGFAVLLERRAKEKGFDARAVHLERPSWDWAWRAKFAFQAGRQNQNPNIDYPLPEEVARHFQLHSPPTRSRRHSPKRFAI